MVPEELPINPATEERAAVAIQSRMRGKLSRAESMKSASAFPAWVEKTELGHDDELLVLFCRFNMNGTGALDAKEIDDLVAFVSMAPSRP